mmetsp:Transcript_23528/g.50084  ORF Transcript_23528/g.50084 Transcript_23528/m.50084 type:complete len:129 (+) Transcript_23528:1201-1587(+)
MEVVRQPPSAGPQHVEPDEPLVDRIAAMEQAAQQLQDDLANVLSGLADLKEHTRPAEATAGDRQADRMRKEVGDVLRMQTEGLVEMSRSVQAFPRRWARLEVNTSQRKSLLLNIKARRRRDQEEALQA